MPLEWIGRTDCTLIATIDVTLGTYLSERLGPACRFVGNSFELGQMVSVGNIPRLVIIDRLFGRKIVDDILRVMKERFPLIRVIELGADSDVVTGDKHECFRRPFDPELLAHRIRTLLSI